MPDTAVYKSQIEQKLKERYFPIIPPLQQNWTQEQHDKNRLSRSLAAFAIENQANALTVRAASAIVDGGNDNGIDAVYFDKTQKRLWLVQSKAGGSPNLGDNKKFCDGIRDLVEKRFYKFNDTFQRLLTDVEEALDTPGVVIVGCNIHLGDKLGPHAIMDLEQLKGELNQFVARFDWADLNLSVVYEWLKDKETLQPIEAVLQLEKWYMIDQPFRAFYGLVSARQMAILYRTHGNALFQKNIRYYLGLQGVNASISATVKNEPSRLFYLNNGLTAICTGIDPVPGVVNAQGTFHVHGFSIVNGAQTVGSIATTYDTPEEISLEAKLLLTLIEVGETGAQLGTLITSARNTQNAIQAMYFASLDPQQERLRQELAISGIIYHYRPSAEALHESDTTITMEQAALSLVCFKGDTQIVVAAKKEIGQIYDPAGIYYPDLFKPDLTGIHLCRVVRIFQYLNEVLDGAEKSENSEARRAFFRHGRFFILHIFAKRNQTLLNKNEGELSTEDKLQLSRVVLDLAEAIYAIAEDFFHADKGYLSIFRNSTDAVPLAQQIIKRLAEPNTQQEETAPVDAIAPGA